MIDHDKSGRITISDSYSGDCAVSITISICIVEQFTGSKIVRVISQSITILIHIIRIAYFRCTWIYGS